MGDQRMSIENKKDKKEGEEVNIYIKLEKGKENRNRKRETSWMTTKGI